MNPADIAKMVISIYEHPGNVVTEEIVLRPIEGDL